MEALALGVAFGASALLGFTAISLGERLGLVDLPDGGDLKGHSGRPVPLGGLGLLAGLHAGLAVLGLLEPGLIAATVLLWVVGILDDRSGLDPKVRLLASGLAGLLLGLLQDPFPGWLALTAHVVVVVVVVNAVNLFDGLDALAGSVGVVAAAGLALLAASMGRGGAISPLLLAAALLGFLLWNLPPARLFLGDNGAYVLGAALAWAALEFSHGWAAGSLAVAMIGVPLIDLGATILRRLRSGSRLFGGDRDHSYDRLHRAGMSVGAIAALFTVGQLLWTGGLLLLGRWQQPAAAAVAVSVAVAGSVWLGLAGLRPGRAPRH